MGVEVTTKALNENEKTIFVKGIPPLSQLQEKINKVMISSTWMERHGTDAIIHLIGSLTFIASLFLMASSCWSLLLLGAYLHGVCYWMVAAKAAHMALHNACCESKSWGKFWSWFFVEFIGWFSDDAAYDIHIKQHHPFTNIIGLGDSSTWRVPFLPRLVYLFGAPMLIPILTPIIGFLSLWGQWLQMMRFFISLTANFALMSWPLVSLGGYSYLGAFAFIIISRCPHAIGYLHLNIFQHIGLPMYKSSHRPTRLFQMTSGVMSIDRHPMLDWIYGHSLVSCHTEHHLFPRLSDNMCLKVKPLVREYLTSLNLPYNQRPYLERLTHFYDNYEELIVKTPPIIRYVGIQ